MRMQHASFSQGQSVSNPVPFFIYEESNDTSLSQTIPELQAFNKQHLWEVALSIKCP